MDAEDIPARKKIKTSSDLLNISGKSKIYIVFEHSKLHLSYRFKYIGDQGYR